MRPIAPKAIAPEAIAIVIFGAAVWPDGTASPTLRRRVEAAAAFGSMYENTLYVPTGAIGRYGCSEARVMADLLRRFGVGDEQVCLEETGVNTITSAFAVAHLLKGFNGRVYAASSRYHLARCRLLLHLAGCPALACPPPVSHPSDVRHWVRETVAFPVDFVRGAIKRGLMFFRASGGPYRK
jgi:vancomycin permeability regulator SanA